MSHNEYQNHTKIIQDLRDELAATEALLQAKCGEVDALIEERTKNRRVEMARDQSGTLDLLALVALQDARAAVVEAARRIHRTGFSAQAETQLDLAVTRLDELEQQASAKG